MDAQINVEVEVDRIWMSRFMQLAEVNFFE